MSARIDTLPFHLGLAMTHWWTSNAVLQLAKNGLQYWSPPLRTSPRDKGKEMDLQRWSELFAADPALQKEVQKEAHQRLVSLLHGVDAYQTHPYERTLKEPPVRWKRGHARLLDYAPSATSDAPVILFIPSLINRYYILDLTEKRSLARHLADEGFRPFILDWGSPGREEMGFGCSQYVTEYIIDALEEIHDLTGRPAILAGYCMGGLLALAAAQIRPELTEGLALLATPWDFHSDDFHRIDMDEKTLKQLRSLINAEDTLPPYVIQMWFYAINPWVFHAKFRHFSQMDPDSEAAQDFMALENWVNDGVPMTRKVARECLIDWAHHNTPATKQWKIAGMPIDPELVECPAFVAAPLNDHIVPVECAMKLTTLLPDVTTVNPPSGHVSMVVGHKAPQELWHPFMRWLNSF